MYCTKVKEKELKEKNDAKNFLEENKKFWKLKKTWQTDKLTNRQKDERQNDKKIERQKEIRTKRWIT